MNPEIFTLKKYSWYKELWWNIQYYCWNVPSTLYYNVKWFFRNLWRFRKQLWKFRTWDFSYCNSLFADSLEWLADQIKNGHEEQRSADKKVEKITELVKMLRKLTNDTDFGTLDDPEIWDGHKLLIGARELADIQLTRMYSTLFRILRILRGQDPSQLKHALTSKEYDEYVKEFDGTGYYSWWE